MKFFLDTYALIEIVNGNPKYQKYLESDGVLLKANLAELYYFLLKEHNEKTADFFFEKFSHRAVVLPLPIISKAMRFRHQNKRMRFSYADCLGYTYALEHQRFFLTGDRAFKGLKNVELVR